MAGDEQVGDDKRVICHSCDGTCWSRSARGRCLLCKGTGLVTPGVADERVVMLMPVLGPGSSRPGGKPKHIARACLVAAVDVRAFGGARRNARSADGWSYSDAEEIVSLAGDALLPLGVLSTVDHVEPQLEPDGTRRLAVTLLLEHPESGEEWSRTVAVAVRGDDLAQAENAAATSAHAYFLTRVLEIPRGYRTADVALGMEPIEDPGALLAPGPKKGGAPAKPMRASSSVVANALASEVQSAKTVAELDAVVLKLRKAVKKGDVANADHVMLVDLLAECRPRCEANDAGRAAEGPQGAAA